MQQADVVALGTVARLVNSDSADAMVELNIGQVIQGQPGALTLVAAITPPFPDISPGQIFPPASIGKTCIWFLKATGGVFRILPLVQGLWAPNDVCLPLAAAPPAPSASGDTPVRQLLAYLVHWYQSLSHPSRAEDELLLGNLAAADKSDAIAAITPLLGSVVVSHQVAGLAAAIRTGSDDALARLAAGFSSFQSNPKISLVVDSLRMPWPPRDIASIPALQQLASLHADVPGFDVALASALAGIRAKEVLPAMVQLLSSKDPQAQRAAAAFFGKFALLADKHGNLPGGGPIGPFASPQTMQYTPRKNSSITTAEYATFWQDWWAKNKANLGF